MKKLFVFSMAVMMAGAISACNAGGKAATDASTSTESQADSKQAAAGKSEESKKEDLMQRL